MLHLAATILQKLVYLECSARYMLVEARGLAQYQIAFELVDNCSDMTLHSDGTSKKADHT